LLRASILTLVLLIIGCTSSPSIYVDDNLSDRMELAQKLLGKKHKYFDTSMYGDLVLLEDGRQIEINLAEVQNGDVKSLIKLLNEAYRLNQPIAVSGRSAKRTASLLNEAIYNNKYKEKMLYVLYIGNERYYLRLKKKLSNKNIYLTFAKTPPTSP